MILKISNGFALFFLSHQVVYIIERKHSRAASGVIKLMPDKNPNLALFAPTDSRIPRIVIPMSDCPKGQLVIHLAVKGPLNPSDLV